MASAYLSSFEDHGSLPEGAVKILLLGDPNCGKTSLIRKFYAENKTSSPFPHYTALVFPCYIEIDDERVEIGLYDILGSEDHRLIQQRCFDKIDVFIFCYAIDSHDSLQNLSHKWIPGFRNHLMNARTVLVGTKMDIRNRETRGHPYLDSYVSFDRGLNLKNHHRLNDFLECSSHLNEGVNDVFINAVTLTR